MDSVVDPPRSRDVLLVLMPKPKPAPQVQVIPLPEFQAAFERDGFLLGRYYFNPALIRPFVYPVNGPGGRSLTRMGYPHDPESHSHHNSVWIAHHDGDGVNFRDDGGGAIRNSAGGRNEAGVLWQQARWVIYSGPVTSRATEGLTLMDHPAKVPQPIVRLERTSCCFPYQEGCFMGGSSRLMAATRHSGEQVVGPTASECRHVDHDAVFDIALLHAAIGVVDLVHPNQLDVGGDVLFGAVVRHLLCFRQAASQRSHPFGRCQSIFSWPRPTSESWAQTCGDGGREEITNPWTHRTHSTRNPTPHSRPVARVDRKIRGRELSW